MNEEISLTFAGCGFLALYYAGVVVCLKKHAPQLNFKHISGASAGAFAACAFLCDVQPDEFISGMCEMIGSARRRTLGPLNPFYNITDALRKQLRKLYPDDAHVKVNGRLRVSLTRVSDGKNVVVDRFESKKELVECLLASSFVPVFSGLVPPKIRGVRYIDGMFSDNLPRSVEHTITVSPFSGESGICPKYDALPLFHLTIFNTGFAVSYPNIRSLVSIFWPPTAKDLKALSQQGFEDTLRYLYINNLNCINGLPAQPTCENRQTPLHEAIAKGLPTCIVDVYQHYINSEN